MGWMRTKKQLQLNIEVGEKDEMIDTRQVCGTREGLRGYWKIDCLEGEVGDY